MVRTKVMRLLVLSLLLLCGVSNVWAQKFAVLTDIHVTPGNANDGKLREAVKEINASDVAAVIVSGDLTNEGSDEQLKHVKSILDQITKPSYVIPGNHEVTWSQSACKTFTDLWGTDRFVFQEGNLLVVGMNCGPFMKMGDGHIKQEDLIWLEKTLTERVKPGMRVLSVNHYPLLDDLDNYTDYVKILQRFPVVTHQCGHYHAWRQFNTGGIDGVVCRALDLGKGNYGYSTLDITADSVKVYEKFIGKPAELKYAYKINLNYTPIEEEKVSNKIPAGYRVDRVFADVASIFTRLGVDEGYVYFGNSLGQVKAVNKVTGQVKWTFQTDGMLFSRPAVSKKYVIVPTSDHRLVWLNKKDGSVAFEYKDAGPYMADGVISKGVLYQGGFKKFQAWNVDKQKLIWEYDSIFNYCQAAPVVDGNDVVFGAWDTNLRSLNRKTGKLNWVWNNGIKANLYSPGNVVPVVTKDRVLTVAPDRVTTVLYRATGKQIWRQKNENKVREALGANADKTVAYAKTMDGTILAQSTTSNDFEQKWLVDAGLGYEHAPCILVEQNGIVYAGSRRGVIVAVDAATQQLILSAKVGKSEVNGIEVDEKGNIYFSLVEGTVWRVTPPAKK